MLAVLCGLFARARGEKAGCACCASVAGVGGRKSLLLWPFDDIGPMEYVGDGGW